jgi:hypothetical protein
MSEASRQRARQQILARCDALAVGEAHRFAGDLVLEAFPAHPWTGRPTLDAWLEHLPGANYGAFRITHALDRDEYTVARHPRELHPVRQDWDRRSGGGGGMSDEVGPRALTYWDLLTRLRTVMREDDENVYATKFLQLALSELMAKRAWETDTSRAQMARWLRTDFVPEVLSLYDDLPSRPQPAAGAGEGEA